MKAVLSAGYRTFFEKFCSASFSSLVSIMRSSCKVSVLPSNSSRVSLCFCQLITRWTADQEPDSQREDTSEFDMCCPELEALLDMATAADQPRRPHLLNFVCWFLEFHRGQHAIQDGSSDALEPRLSNCRLASTRSDML